jgi:hypothetical protein
MFGVEIRETPPTKGTRSARGPGRLPALSERTALEGIQAEFTRARMTLLLRDETPSLR